MTVSPNVAASVKQRLLNLARKRGIDFNLLLTWYGIERLLFRLSRSGHERQFVLKGAMLFHVWRETPHRPTTDVDLLGRGSREPRDLASVFRELCAEVVEDDGIAFAPESVSAEGIREGAEYRGVRIKLYGLLGSARIPVQVDVGFGDAIIPAPEIVELPALLGHPAPRLRAYRRETVVAEKLHALVDLGIANTRMKDFFDLRFLASTFAFDGPVLIEAIAATFARRRTPLPQGVPTGLTEAFASDALKQEQWTAFLRRSRLEAEEFALGVVVAGIREFLVVPLAALEEGRVLSMSWQPGGPWQPWKGTAG